MSTKNSIGLADLATSFKLLRPRDAEARLRIAEALGMEGRPLVITPTGGGPGGTGTTITGPKPGGTGDVAPVATTVPVKEERAKPQQRTEATLSFDLSDPLPPTTRPGEGQEPEWWNSVQVIEPSKDPAEIPPPDPLLLPAWSRATYMRWLSSPVPEGRLDIPRLVDLVARLEIPSTLPRLPWQTMRNGLQLLIDYGASMTPFLADQDVLLADAQALVGGAAFLEVILFRGTPLRWAEPLYSPPERELTGYKLPFPGTAILAVTDLGINALEAGQEYTPPEEWIKFAATANAAGCPFVVFSPYHPQRAPVELRREFPIVHWHHPRTAGRKGLPPLQSGTGAVWDQVERLRSRNPQAVALAHVASLARRIEQSLLRRLRLKLLPEADGGAEADLWFSPLVSVRTETALLLRTDVAQALRQNLARSDPELFEQAWQTLDAFRADSRAFEGTRLEERLNYLLALRGTGTDTEIQTLLRTAVKTVVERGSQGDEGLALWSVELLDALPPEARQTEAGRDLGVAAGFRLDPKRVPQKTLPVDLGGRQWFIPVNVTGLDDIDVWVGREEGGLVLADKQSLVQGGKLLAGKPPSNGSAAIRGVPATTPVVLWLAWDGHREKIAVQPGRRAGPFPLPSDNRPVTLETFLGTQWTLTPSVDQATVVEETPDEAARLDRSGRGLAEVPEEVWARPGLKRLDLSGNKLTALPPRIGELADLEELILDGNALEGLPEEAGKLTKLRVLSAARNGWREIPPAVRSMQQLERLELAGNQLGSLPQWLRKLRRLVYLDLRENQFTQYDEHVASAVRDLLESPEAILSAFELALARSGVMAELHVALMRRGNGYGVTLRYRSGEDTSEEVLEGKESIALDVIALKDRMRSSAQYGQDLSRQLFADDVLLSLFSRAVGTAESQGDGLRIRWQISPNALELEQLAWETLGSPDSDGALLLRDGVQFYRYVTPAQEPPLRGFSSGLTALVAAGSPDQSVPNGYPPGTSNSAESLDVIRKSFVGIPLTELTQPRQLTLENTLEQLSKGFSILYLEVPVKLQGDEAILIFSQTDGMPAPATTAELAERMHKVQTPPRLIVFAGQLPEIDAGTAPWRKTAKALLDAGVGAVIFIPSYTPAVVAEFLPALFEELASTGWIDSAVAAGRRAVLPSIDWWTPVLYAAETHLFAAEDQGRPDTKQESLLYASGINGDTGDYLQPPVSVAELAQRIRAEGPGPDAEELRGRQGYGRATSY